MRGRAEHLGGQDSRRSCTGSSPIGAERNQQYGLAPEPYSRARYVRAECWALSHAVGDVRMVGAFREIGGVDVDPASDAARAMVEPEEFVRVARLIESELVYRPWLSGDDVQAALR